MNKAMVRAALVAVAVVVGDQLAKTQAVSARNVGVVTGATPISGLLLLAISVLVLGAFLAVIGRWAVEIGITPVAPALVAAGMFAHTLDRVRFGGVRDFVHTPWLIVDIADLAIVAGVALLFAAAVVRAYQLHRNRQTIEFDATRLRLYVKDA